MNKRYDDLQRLGMAIYEAQGQDRISLLARLLMGDVQMFNSVRLMYPQIPFVLDEADLSGQDLRGANLSNVSLRMACLDFTNLSNTTLYGSHLTGANISNAHFLYGNLQRCDFEYATIHESSFVGADLSGARFTDATIKSADFRLSNLSSITYNPGVFDTSDMRLTVLEEV